MLWPRSPTALQDRRDLRLQKKETVMKRFGVRVAGFGMAAALCLPPWAGAVGHAAREPAAATVSVPNCIGRDTIAYQPGDTGTVLDSGDREVVTREILARYPMLARDGLAPTAVVLWHEPLGEWLYAALQPHPERPDLLCFSANVVADDLGVTTHLLKKYFLIVEPL